MQETSSTNSQLTNKPKINLSIFILVGIIILVGISYFLFKSSIKNSNKTENESNTRALETELKKISLAEISGHNTKTDCWTTINGEVFDLTKFIGMHKGGDRILAACGVDATDYFTGKHPTIGRVHSQMAVKILSGMKIGDLQK